MCQSNIARYYTLPHNGSLDVYLQDTYVMTMALEAILRKNFGQIIGNLVLCADQDDLNEAVLHMLAKMMMTHVNMFDTKIQLGKPHKF